MGVFFLTFGLGLMVLTLTIRSTNAPFTKGGPPPDCQNLTVKAREGEDAYVLCRPVGTEDLTDYTLELTRHGRNKSVHVYRERQDISKEQEEQYKNRTYLNHEDLSRGIYNLSLKSVQLSDKGQLDFLLIDENGSRDNYCIDLTVEKVNGMTEDPRRVRDGIRSPFNVTDVLPPVITFIVILLLGCCLYIFYRRKCWNINRCQRGNRRQTQQDDRTYRGGL